VTVALIKEEMAQMSELIMNECVYEHRHKLLNVLEQIFTTAVPTSSSMPKKGWNLVANQPEAMYQRSKLYHDFLRTTVAVYNSRNR